jgi:hypothetical protein
MKKFLPYIIILICLIAGVSYFIYEYSPSTLEKKESDFAVHNIGDMTRVKLTSTDGHMIELTKSDKRWLLNGKYEINEATRDLLFTALQKLETNYRTPINAEPYVFKDIAKEHTKCEIYMNNENKPSKVYYVGGPTADGKGTYMIMERDGQIAKHSYVTHIAGVDAYLTGRYYPLEERWRSIWVYRDNSQTIQSVKVTYLREKQKSLEITRVAKDSFVIANSEGQVLDQPKQKFIHQYLDFYNGLALEAYRNEDTAARDTIQPMEPFCTIDLKRTDKTEQNVILYYIPVNDRTRVQFDDDGRKLLYDPEHYYLFFNDKKDFALIQFYTWGKVLRNYQDFFVKPSEGKTP